MWQNRGLRATTRARVFWTRWRWAKFETDVPAWWTAGMQCPYVIARAWLRQWIDYKICFITYKTFTNQQPLSTNISLSHSLLFPSHSVSTRSSDSLVLSIRKRILFLCHRSTTGIHSLLIPETHLSTNILFQAQNKPLQNCYRLDLSHPPWLFTRILILAILILCPIEWHLMLDTAL